MDTPPVNWFITLLFADEISPICALLFGKNVDDGEIFDNVLFNNDWPSGGQLFIVVDAVGRSFSDIVRVNSDGCWDTIVESIEVDESRGMFEFDIVDPELEYNDVGSVLFVDDATLIWDILLRTCWDNIPTKIYNNKFDKNFNEIAY